MQSASPLILVFTGLLGTWFGAAVFYVLIIGPAAAQAGPSAVGFLLTLARRRGAGPFYAVLAFLTVITGVSMLLVEGMYRLASSSDLWGSLSVGLTALALVLGASANRIAERKWIDAVKTAEGACSSGA
ncbi:hypothetical protein [Inquilinus limosus]|uniref:hypothetical protein n=1 Tax=Inquilinus limosus TaxID=171674 RepID=UPI00040AD335|nr:hypothetical protein [Inquilinus limosus]